MSEYLPYEEQMSSGLADLPLPDENMAWEDMKRRLEEDDDDGIIPFWLRGCGLWGLLLVLLIGIGGYFFYLERNRTKRISEKTTITKGKDANVNARDVDSDKNLSSHTQNNSNNKKNRGEIWLKDETNSNNDYFPEKNNTDSSLHQKSVTENADVKESASFEKGTKRRPTAKLGGRKKEKKPEPTLQKTINTLSSIPNAPVGQALDTTSDDNQIKADALLSSKNDKSITKTGNIDSTRDTTQNETGDSTEEKTNQRLVKNDSAKEDSSQKRAIIFGAGLSVNQLIPVAGQEWSPYNAEGRKMSIADYVPSVYFRMYRNDKWFLQSEFRYGAPQYNRELLYYQKIVTDTPATNTRTTTSAKLKKTFYHQLPISFNYFVLPNWSVGGGFIWNKFSAAVSERDVIRRDISSGIDSVISSGVLFKNNKADSNFVNTYFQLLFETQYKWNRISIGARYSFGLQPYLRFTLPGGVSSEETNSSLNIFIRYEIWRSRKKYE